MESKLKTPLLTNLISFSLITVGALFSAFALETFLIPNSILDGGVTGISMIISNITPIPLSILIIVLNIPFILVGYKALGKRFLIKTVYAMLMFSVLLMVFKGTGKVTNDMLLATIYGGLLLGIGVGLIIKGGACLDGTESVAIVISKKTSLSVGQVVMIFNIIIYSVAALLFGLDKALYSLLTYFITFKIIDIVSEGLEQAKAAMIITENGEKMSKEIYKKLGRTVTFIQGHGLISGKKDVLYCVLTRLEIPQLRTIVNKTDKTAFITLTEVSEIIGDHIKSNKKIKQVKQNIKVIKGE